MNKSYSFPPEFDALLEAATQHAQKSRPAHERPVTRSEIIRLALNEYYEKRKGELQPLRDKLLSDSLGSIEGDELPVKSRKKKRGSVG